MRFPDCALFRRTLAPVFILVALGQLASAQSIPPVRTFIRINQLGYLPEGPKTAVVCSLDQITIGTFTIQNASGRVVFGPRKAVSSGPFGPCVTTSRLNFTSLRKPGRYTIVAGGAVSPSV